MRSFFKTTTVLSGKTGSLLLAGALFAVALSTAPATAGFAQQTSDNAQLLSRINQLENQIQTLSHAFYRGGTPPAALGGASGAVDTSAIASFESRLSQIETQQRSLTGQIERMTHDINVLQEKLDRAQADNEQRFQQLEGNARPATGAATTTAPAAASGNTQQGAVLQGDLYAEPKDQSIGTLGSKSDPANSLYESGFNDIREAKYDGAEDKFKRFLSLYPKHALAANAQYWLAETYYVRGDYAQASRLFAQGYQDYPKGNKAADSLLKLGLSLAQTGKKEDACLSFQQLKKDFPGEQTAVIRRAEQEAAKLGC